MQIKKHLNATNLLYILLTIAAIEIIALVIENKNLKADIESHVRARSPVKVGDVLQTSYSLKKLDGKDFDLKDYVNRNERIFLIFLSTDCPACELDISIWSNIYELSKSANFALLAVSLDNQIETERFVRLNRLGIEFVFDPEHGPFFKHNRIFSVPKILLLNSEGEVLNLWDGSVRNKASEILYTIESFRKKS